LKILFRTDSSAKIGTGHVTRCLSLAFALKAHGHDCKFICQDLKGNSINKIKKNGFEVIMLKIKKYEKISVLKKYLDLNWKIDSQYVIEKLHKHKFDWVIIDHYLLSYQWEKKIRPFAKKIMVIDDFVKRKHYCDLLLNQSYGIKKQLYKNSVPKHCKLLLGSKYALVNQNFLKARLKLKSRNTDVKRALIYFGSGSHTTKYIKTILKIFNENFYRKIFLDIVVDKNFKKSKEIAESLKRRRNSCIHYDLPDLSGLMMKADFSIGTAGSTTWERCCLGLPTILINSSLNQKLNSKAMELTKAAIVLKPNKNLENNIREFSFLLCTNSKIYLKISKKAYSICDGNGIERVINHLNQNEQKLS
tara:strand:+ start:12944 stop:14026 length:1083 start_codon:yes stop_codon:yes gene_type:complete